MDEESTLAGDSVVSAAMRKSRGGRIKFLREAHEPTLKREQLAEMGGWHPNTVGTWERDESVPDPENCLKLAELLGVPVEVFLIP